MEEVKSKKPVLLVVVLVFIFGLVIGGFVHSYYQDKGLKDRTTTLENRMNNTVNSMGIAESEDGEPIENKDEEIDYEILEIADKKVRVISSWDPSGEIKYTEKDTKEYTVKITNKTSWQYDYNNDLRAQTESGLLLLPLERHPDDMAGEETYFSLAPGGVTTVKLYYAPANDQKIIGLYDSMNGSSI